VAALLSAAPPVLAVLRARGSGGQDAPAGIGTLEVARRAVAVAIVVMQIELCGGGETLNRWPDLEADENEDDAAAAAAALLWCCRAAAAAWREHGLL
jgi:hypothetical protein